jgi:RNA polymerase sigma factor (sigma-70 family)
LRIALPVTLSRLQLARDGAERDMAWTEFVATHSSVVLHTCRALTREHDATMDAYTFVLEALREHDHRRLRAYVPDGKTPFTTWLIVVTRRLVLDHVRARYGRLQSADPASREDYATRRRLEDLLATEIEPDQLEGGYTATDAAIRHEQLTQALQCALARLEPEERLLITLRFLDGRPVRDIARALKLSSVFHVYRRLDAVLQRLRESLVRIGVEDAEP